MAFRILSGRRRGGSKGFSLPVVLILIAVTSYGASRLELGAHYRSRRDREEELLFRGAACMKAIKSFYLVDTDPSKKRLPRSLDELVKDPRAQNRRFLRALYKDPITGQDFKLMRRPEGIVGVASPSDAAPLQRVDIAQDLGLTENAQHYSEWVFEAQIAAAPPSGVVPGRPLAPTQSATPGMTLPGQSGAYAPGRSSR